MALVSTQSANEDLLALQKRNDERLAEQGGGNAALAFAKDVKQSLLFQYDWGELLSAAPLCLSLMGSCYVAATSPKAAGLSLKECEPKDGFKKIRNPELKACLIQVSDTGRFAFLEAEKKMDLIQAGSNSISQSLSIVGTLLAQLPAKDAALNLDKKLTMLKDRSDDCLKYAQDIEKKFIEWLELVCEVHQVTVAKEEKTSIAQDQNAIALAGLEVESELTQVSVNNAAEAAKTMKENMEASRKTFEKAADAIPGPLAQIGLQLASSLAQAATTTISQGLPMMMGGMMGGPMGAAAMRGAGQQGQANGNSGRNKGGKRSNNTQNGNSNGPDASDPAYQAALLVNVPITLLMTLLGVDTNKGVDWDNLNPPLKDGKASKDGLTMIETTLSHTLNTTSWTNGTASQDLKKSLTDLKNVIAGVKAELAKEKDLTAKKPDADAPVVKEWQKTTNDAKVKVSSLATTAGSLPGSAPGSAPMIGKQPDAASGNDQNGANAALKSAHEKLNMTEAAYTASQANYQKAIENRTKVEGQLAKIKADLKKMELTQAKMDEIKQVLIQCIGTLIQMKRQIQNLVNFFSALSAMVEHVVKQNVREFMDQVDVAKTCLIGNISLSDVSRQELFTTTLMCQAYFSLFSSIASMYNKISVNHIKRGISICDELSKTDNNPNAISQKMRVLDEFTDAAQKAVADEVSKFQKQTTESLDKRVTMIQADTKILPALPPAIKNAITDGKETVTSAVADSISSQVNPIVAVSADDI